MSENIEEMVGAYLNIRSAREALLRKFEVEDGELKDDLKKIEQVLLSVCNELNVSSIKTTLGTVMRKLNERFYCTDWDSFKDFIRQNDALELFERRVHQGNFKHFMEEHPDIGMPPGINQMREHTIVIRKSNKLEEVE
jgi:hypothetical protein